MYYLIQYHHLVVVLVPVLVIPRKEWMNYVQYVETKYLGIIMDYLPVKVVKDSSNEPFKIRKYTPV